MKRFLSALILRFLPALQPPAVMLDARDSLKRALAAVSSRLPSEMPAFQLPRLPELTLPRLPELSLPKLPELSMPRLKFPALPEMPSMPSMPSMAGLGRFLSGLSISTLVFAPGQLQGIAAFCHFAAGDLTPQADVPRTEQISTDPGRAPSLLRSAVRLLECVWDRLETGARAWRPVLLAGAPRADALPPAAPLPRRVVAAELAWPAPQAESVAEVWFEDCERGQRPPPVLA
ncbi:MAG: hypothetical protein JSR82_14385 [Verrucomicrobia bacterium]|nr:hypothetical protein [Verrucomicrobiota bacterium]